MSISINSSGPTFVSGYFPGLEANCQVREWWVDTGTYERTNDGDGLSPAAVRADGCSWFPKRPGTWHYVSVIMSFLNTGSEITQGAAAYYYNWISLCDLISFKIFFCGLPWIKENKSQDKRLVHSSSHWLSVQYFRRASWSMWLRAIHTFMLCRLVIFGFILG